MRSRNYSPPWASSSQSLIQPTSLARRSLILSMTSSVSTSEIKTFSPATASKVSVSIC
jgi:hypothetical protein